MNNDASESLDDRVTTLTSLINELYQKIHELESENSRLRSMVDSRNEQLNATEAMEEAAFNRMARTSSFSFSAVSGLSSEKTIQTKSMTYTPPHQPARFSLNNVSLMSSSSTPPQSYEKVENGLKDLLL